MAQARRKKPARISPKKGARRNNIKPLLSALKRGFGLFISGALTGVLVMLFWQGYQSDSQADLGSGLREMIEQSRIQAKQRAEATVPPVPILVDNAPRVKPEYDFYTVLPEIEEVLPSDAPPAQVPNVSTAKVKNKPKPKTVKTKKPPKPLKAGSAYMLQVASYGHRKDAQRLKAKLALGGLRASIQKVAIEKKNYFRVRIGPYKDYGSMTSDDYKLSKMGFKALRLKLSQAG